MLKQLSFNNYKAFDNGSIEIRPITILLGANSVGKSSILQLLLLLQQTSEADKTYKSALKLNGGYISLGEGLNLIRGKDSKKPLILTFDFRNHELFSRFKQGFLATLCSQVLIQTVYLDNLARQNNNSDSNVEDILRKFGKKNKKGEFEYDLSTFIYDDESVNKIIEPDDFKYLVEYLYKEMAKSAIKLSEDLRFLYYHRRNSFSGFNGITKNKDEFLLAYDFLLSLSKVNLSEDFSITYTLFNASDNTIKIKEICLKSNDKVIMSIEFDNKNKSRNVSVNSKFIENSSFKSSLDLSSLSRNLDSSKTIFDFLIWENEYSNANSPTSILSSIIFNILREYIKSIENSFAEDKINYVSPLRAHPKRYYFLDKAKINKYLDTLDGDSLTEILRENLILKSQVNTWLSKFNLQVDVDQLKDIIHKLVIKQNSLSLDITDVGFGISQVLPVIVQGFLSSNGSLTIIEQPEIHLHPKMQADLADLFIDIISGSKKDPNFNKYLLIETHSEYLLKRLRRRISEGVINPKQVAIYLIDPQQKDKGARLRMLDIEEKGNFEWPSDFYSEELMSDTFEFLKNQ